MSETITIPAPPTSVSDVLGEGGLLQIAGLQLLKPGFEYAEANIPPDTPLYIAVKRAHHLISIAGYILKDATGVDYGAGGGGKPPW
jgi:hypothetical protein